MGNNSNRRDSNKAHSTWSEEVKEEVVSEMEEIFTDIFKFEGPRTFSETALCVDADSRKEGAQVVITGILGS